VGMMANFTHFFARSVLGIDSLAFSFGQSSDCVAILRNLLES